MIMIEEVSKSIKELEKEVEMWKRECEDVKFNYFIDGMMIGCVVTLIAVFLFR